MTYIWNRADRAPEKLMPNVLHESFVKWEKNQLEKITNRKFGKKYAVLKAIFLEQ